MDIQEIKRRFDLLKMANNERYCLLSELAKELKVRKTDLMKNRRLCITPRMREQEITGDVPIPGR